jgi:hypothetical protein
MRLGLIQRKKNLRRKGQNMPLEKATLQKLAKKNEIKQHLEETRNEICKIIENDEKRMGETLT